MSDRINPRIVFLECFLALLLLISRPLSSQQNPSRPTRSQSAPVATFKSSSDLVLVPVVVRDKKGKHVSGLPQSAFRLEEKGKEQTITLFEKVSAPTTDAAGSTPRYEAVFQPSL